MQDTSSSQAVPITQATQATSSSQAVPISQATSASQGMPQSSVQVGDTAKTPSHCPVAAANDHGPYARREVITLKVVSYADESEVDVVSYKIRWNMTFEKLLRLHTVRAGFSGELATSDGRRIGVTDTPATMELSDGDELSYLSVDKR